MKRKIIITMLIATMAFTQPIYAQTISTSTSSESITLTSGALTAEYKKKDLDTDYTNAVTIADGVVNGTGAVEKDGVITISQEGTYVLSGSYTGQVLISATEDAYVHLVLDGFSITNENGSAIYAKQCDKLTITLADGTVNAVADGTEYTAVDEDGEPDGAIYTDCDLSINGNGTLKVTGNYADAIKCKKDLKLISGTYNITAVSEGIKGRNSVVIKDGTYNITAKDTAIKSTKDTDADKGYVIIDGGDITINAGNDGIHAETHTTINGGNINIESSYEGIEGQMIDITGGTVKVVASDDGINAARIGEVSNKAEGQNDKQNNGENKGDNKGDDKGFGGGQAPMDFGGKQDGNQAQAPTDFGGKQGDNQTQAPMDFGGKQGDNQAQAPMDFGGKQGGNQAQAPTDFGDKVNNADSDKKRDDKVNQPQDFGGGQSHSSDGQVYINISGGDVTVMGGADCLDANGDLYLSGGNVYVCSQRFGMSGGEAMLDADNSIVLKSGLTFIAAGASSTVSGITTEQNIFYMYLDSSESGKISMYDGDSLIASYTPDTSYSMLVVTSPKLEVGKTYTVDINGEKTEVTLTDSTTTIGTHSSSSMGGGRGMGKSENKNQTKFTDVDENSSYYKAVSMLSMAGAMSGTSETTFSPDATLTRGMAVSVLGRLAKGTPTDGATAFTDVADGMYYSDYVKWASQNNIVSGYGNGVFGVNDSITQKQLQIIISNYAKMVGFEYTVDSSADDTPVTRAEFAQALYNVFATQARNK